MTSERERLIKKMVDRFLGWPLPKTFAPDCGIDFAPLPHPNSWPIGTNLLTATEARAMVEHMLGDAPSVDDFPPCGALYEAARAALPAPADRVSAGALTGATLRNCRTDPELLALLDKAAKRRISPTEIFEQRVSWCWGMLGDESGITKDQVRRMLLERYGEPSNPNADAAVVSAQHGASDNSDQDQPKG